MSLADSELRIGWTTVSTESEAVELARKLVKSGCAVCVQIDGPIRSIYRWKAAVEDAAEWRLMVKFLLHHEERLVAVLNASHPYDVPEWVVVRPDSVSPEYLAWANEQG